MSTAPNNTARIEHTHSDIQTARKTRQNASQTDNRQEELAAYEPTLPVVRDIQILHIKLWYQDGSQGELNITSPKCVRGEDLEVQYIYMKKYLRKMAPLLGITAYQGNMATPDTHGPRIFGIYPKVDCSCIPPYPSGKYCDEHDRP